MRIVIPKSWNDRWKLGITLSLGLFAGMIPISIFMINLAAIILFITLVGKKITDHPRVYVVPPLTWTILTFILIAILSLIFSPYPTPLEVWAGLRKLRFFIYYFLVFYALFETRQVKFPLWCFIGGCAASALLGWTQFFGGNHDWVKWFNDDLVKSPFVDRFRAMGFASHHRRFAMTVGFAIPLVGALWIHYRHKWKNGLFYFFLLLLFGGGIFFAHGRGELLALILSTLLVPWVRSFRFGVLSVVGLVILALGLYIFVPQKVAWFGPKAFEVSSKEVFYEDLKKEGEPQVIHTSNDIRVALWRLSWELFRKHPVLGIGWGQFSHRQDIIQEAIQEAENYPHRHPHSEWVWVGVELGIIGLLVFAFFCVTLLHRLIMAYRT